jgi:DNA transformation protein and related proteins
MPAEPQQPPTPVPPALVVPLQPGSFLVIIKDTLVEMLKTAYLDFILDWLAPLGTITSRSMMGGYILYCDGIVFALLADNVLHLKVDDATRPGFEALRLKPFQPFSDKPGTMQYYPPPAEFFEDADVMAEWGRAAVEVGRRASAKRKSKSKKPPRRSP